MEKQHEQGYAFLRYPYGYHNGLIINSADLLAGYAAKGNSAVCGVVGEKFLVKRSFSRRIILNGICYFTL